jgi:hypothetical protein
VTLVLRTLKKPAVMLRCKAASLSRRRAVDGEME